MFDPNPVNADKNREKHGVSFDAAEAFEWESALKKIETSPSYDEVRTLAIGFIGSRLHVMVFTRRGQRIRLISLRKAHPKEVRTYAEF